MIRRWLEGVAIGVLCWILFFLGTIAGRKSVREECIVHQNFTYDDERWLCKRYGKEPKAIFPSMNSKGELLTWQRN